MNHSNKESRTALMKAGRYHKNIVHLLLAEGADVNMKDKDNKTALHFAASLNKCRSIEILLKAGVDVNRKDIRGETPLIKAVYPVIRNRHDCTKCLDMLIEAGADVNAENSFGETALISTAVFGHVKSMKVLIEAGADVNVGRGIEGRTALFPASESKCVDVLLEAGADVNITDHDDKNALHFWFNIDYDDDDYLDYLKSYCQNIKKLLRAGIHINKFNTSKDKNALETLLDYKYEDQNADSTAEIYYKDPMKLLYAAGETLEGTEEDKIPEELKFDDEKFQLKHICREAIRKHLLKVDSHSNLFGRIPVLGAPWDTPMLLFGQDLPKKLHNNY